MAMISTPLRYQQRSPTKPRALFVLLMLRSLPCYGYAKGDLDNIINRANYVQQPYHSLRHSINSNDSRLRGRLKLNPSMKDRSKQFNDMSSSSGRDSNMNQQQSLQSLVGEETQRRSVEANIPTIFLTPSSTFQIIMSILLAILILLQLSVIVRFVCNRSKRVLEFTQPDAICIFVACSIVATASCYLYIYLSSSFTCAIREPLLFMSVSLMGATVAGRAWRISTLVNNPLLTAGGDSDSNVSKIEQIRQCMLGMLSVLAAVGCSISSLHKRRSTNMSVRREDRRSRPIRVQVTFVQMMRATFFMILPQLFWQIVMLSTPALRLSRVLASNTYLYNGDQMMTMEQYQCQSSVGLWPHCVSVFLALCPYAIAYILNIRPKQELNLLPEMIDEKEKLEQSFYIFARIIAVSTPVIGLTYANSPEARVYSTICAVLALPLASCYYIAYLKLNAIKSSTPSQQSHGTSIGHSRRSSRGKGTVERSSTEILRMAEMYLRIGRAKETDQLVNDEMSRYRKNQSASGGNLDSSIQIEDEQEVSLGFTEMDLKDLEGDELELIIRLIKLKVNALEKLEGIAGQSKVARLNIGALKIFENCPAARKMKDTSFMLPIYNLAGEQIRAGMIDDDDEFSLEMELALHCYHETRLQSYHYVRSLANLTEMYGRIGMPDEAFNYFNIMEAVYMKQDHPKLLTKVYAIDRCAVCYASSALWYLQKGEINNAIERCNYVIDNILPQYDKSDILGLFCVFTALIRVLKWNGEAGKALEAYSSFMPDAANTHWAVGSLHKPTTLLLQICEGNSHQYNDEFLSDDIETVLSFDVMEPQSAYFTNYGWSMNTLAAELCLLFAQRLEADDTSRERLIDRGITMARIAQQRSTTSNGKMKHMLAFEVNEDVHNKLVQLVKDSGVDAIEDFPDPSPNGTISESQDSVKIDLNDNISVMSKQSQSLSFANKLKPISADLEGASSASNSKRREFNSSDSFGSTRKLSSQQSCETIQVDPSKQVSNSGGIN